MKKRWIIEIFFCYVITVIIAFGRPLVIQKIVDTGLVGKTFSVVIVCSIILVGLSIIESGISILQTSVYVNIQNWIVLRLYYKYFSYLLNLKVAYFKNNNSSEIINRITSDIDNISSLFNSGLINTVSYLLQILSGVAGLFVINWKLAIFVLLAVPIKFCLITFFSNKREQNTECILKYYSDFSGWFDDTLNGIAEIKLWNLFKIKKKELIKYQKYNLKFLKEGNLLNSFNLAGDTLLQWIITGFLYGVGGYFVCINEMTVGSLTAFITYSSYVIGPIALIFNLKFLFAQIKPSIKRLQKLKKLENEQTLSGYREIKNFDKEIIFNNVSFYYDKNHPVLNDISLTIKKGERIALIGDNGSGKSTLIQLLLQFYHPQKGQILIDGVDIGEVKLNCYRQLFSVISQDIYLFRDTLRNNILLGKKMTDSQLWQIIEELKLEKFIQSLPQGLNTILDRNGGNLSGGV